MDRRAFVAALGGVFAAGVARAQTAPGLPLVGDVFNATNNAVGAGLAVPGQVLGGVAGGANDVLGGGLGDGALVPGAPFRLTDLMGGEYSIETSHLALTRSRNPHIREFAQLEIAEQVSVAAALGAQPGTVRPRPDQLALVQSLAAMRSGPAFDRAYIAGQIKGHQELLANNEAAIRSPADPAIRRVATLSVPTIQTHLAILARLRAGLAAV
jgi:putative membrane protein